MIGYSPSEWDIIHIYIQHNCKCLLCIQTTIPIDLDMKRKIQLNVTTKHKDFWYHYKWSCFVLLMWDIMIYALELSLYQDLLYLIMFFIVWKTWFTDDAKGLCDQSWIVYEWQQEYVFLCIEQQTRPSLYSILIRRWRGCQISFYHMQITLHPANV